MGVAIVTTPTVASVGMQAGAERQLLKSTQRVASLISSLVFYLVDRSFISLTNLVRLVSL